MLRMTGVHEVNWVVRALVDLEFSIGLKKGFLGSAIGFAGDQLGLFVHIAQTV